MPFIDTDYGPAHCRHWAAAEQIEALRIAEISGGRHDILNDVMHDVASDTITEFVLGAEES